jgi:hypothetical protein
MTERRSVLAAFKEQASVKVILMSLKAGGEGLNLQEASHVLVLEPWWNPQVHCSSLVLSSLALFAIFALLVLLTSPRTSSC